MKTEAEHLRCPYCGKFLPKNWRAMPHKYAIWVEDVYHTECLDKVLEELEESPL